MDPSQAAQALPVTSPPPPQSLASTPPPHLRQPPLTFCPPPIPSQKGLTRKAAVTPCQAHPPGVSGQKGVTADQAEVSPAAQVSLREAEVTEAELTPHEASIPISQAAIAVPLPKVRICWGTRAPVSRV